LRDAVEVSTVRGHYRLDDEARSFFGSPVMHLVQRGDRLIGRFGRRGVVRGVFSGAALEASWKVGERSGWLRVTFDRESRSFAGFYGSGDLRSPLRGCRDATRPGERGP